MRESSNPDADKLSEGQEGQEEYSVGVEPCWGGQEEQEGQEAGAGSICVGHEEQEEGASVRVGQDGQEPDIINEVTVAGVLPFQVHGPLS